VQRLTSPPINVPKSQIDNLNFVMIQNAIYREGVLVRRVLSVNEIIGYDPRSDSALYVPIFTWDPVRDRFTFRGRGTSYLLEEKIGVKRGLSRRNMFLIYEELDVRAKIIKAMIERKVFNYYQVFRVLARIYSMTQEYARKASKEEAPYAILEALEDALKKIQRGDLIR
jgi:flagellar protein FlaI